MLNPVMKRPDIKTLYIYFLAFSSGMCIMAVELSASRLLAPFFGTSTFVWTNIIGIIMVALSIGYIVGGNLADRKPELFFLLKLLVVASLFLLVIPFIAPSLGGLILSFMRDFNSSFSYIFFGSLIAMILLFSLPIVIMGMTGPFLIRIIAKSGRLGGSAGSIFGISTLGSIAGTFLPVLIFIPAYGTGKTILGFAVLQLVVSVLGFFSLKYSLFSASLVGLFLFPVPLPRDNPGKIYVTESAYEYIEVVDRNPYRYLIYNDGAGPQTVARKDSILTGLYYDYFSLLPYLGKKNFNDVLLIGLGGGIIANQIHYFHPGMEITAVEIDPKVIEIAKKYFDLTDTAKVYNQDGRIFERLERGRNYDIIIIDAYTQQLYIPFHLTTAEFFSEVKRTLRDRGIVAMNVSSFNEDSALLKSITNTLHAVFTHVYQIRMPNSFSSIVLVSDDDIDFGALIKAVGTNLQDIGAYTLGTVQEILYDYRYASLTDDRAPVELMVDWQLMKAQGPPWNRLQPAAASSISPF